MEEKIISAEEAVARYNEKINPKLEIKKLLSDGIEAIFIKEINSFIKSAIDNSRNSVDCVISLAEYNEEYKEIVKNIVKKLSDENYKEIDCKIFQLEKGCKISLTFQFS